MTIEKTLIIRKTSKQWRVIIRVQGRDYHKGNGDTLLATFADRSMAIAPMASALVAFEKYLLPDFTVYEGDQAGYDMMFNMGIFQK